jgi:hypothetical protein
MSEEKEKRPCFDIGRPISVKAISSEGIRKIDLRFPTDDEWIERSRRHKLIYRNLGRGIQELVSQEPNEADSELLKRIRIAEGPELDAYEAFRILEELSRTQVIEDGSEADPLRVCLRVPGGITTYHIFRMPTAKERHQCGRLADSRNVNSREIWSLNYAAAGDLYDATCKESVGYAAAVPIIHKLAALQALNVALTRALEGDEPENF